MSVRTTWDLQLFYSLSNFSGTNGLVSQCIILTTADTLYAWHCTGPHSSLTYNDCMGDFFNTSGCYYKMHFAQYRPCSQECNGVTLGAISEERCNAYCPGTFYSNNPVTMAWWRIRSWLESATKFTMILWFLCIPFLFYFEYCASDCCCQKCTVDLW